MLLRNIYSKKLFVISKIFCLDWKKLNGVKIHLMTTLMRDEVVNDSKNRVSKHLKEYHSSQINYLLF